ncbi:restriction endonuclease subunit S [Tenacibaculum piscium]|uniref:restriction endonuclease subunit S n=1 Tax=Tenacibaculum piscium TaxID=1458515 RepID=UPI001F296021|nr:restriction endonuclease subunit S [Tenacibaculum piscium]
MNCKISEAKSNYRKIGDFIQLVDERNKDLKVTKLLGLSISKQFIPSVANTIGTNMKNYKIIRKNQFACSTMQVRRDKKMPIALLQDFEEAIISQAYPVFKIIDETILNSEYLMMWFSRSEFDRHACFLAIGGVRGSLEWEDFLEMPIPVPSIEKQHEIVKEYNTVANRITLNETINKKLEDTAQALYKNWFVENEDKSSKVLKLSDVCNLITDGKHGDCKNEQNSGYYFISIKDLVNGDIIYKNARQIIKSDFEETHRRTNLKKGDILMSNAGTIGRLAITKDLPETKQTTFQKSVAIIKPNKKLVLSYFLYSMLKYNIEEIKELAGGSTQSNLLLGDLRNYEFLYPGFELVMNFEQKVIPIFQRIELNSKENLALKSMRELILSKMSKVAIEKETVC